MRAGAEREDDVARVTRHKVETHVEQEIQAAKVTWEDVPRRGNSWGPTMRQRCEALGQAWIYNTLFASHSNNVHPTWHEIRTFHLTTTEGGLGLDLTYGTMAPIGAYVVARVVAESCGAAATFLPSDLEPVDTAERVADTVEASQLLALEYGEFLARGGEDADLGT